MAKPAPAWRTAPRSNMRLASGIAPRARVPRRRRQGGAGRGRQRQQRWLAHAGRSAPGDAAAARAMRQSIRVDRRRSAGAGHARRRARLGPRRHRPARAGQGGGLHRHQRRTRSTMPAASTTCSPRLSFARRKTWTCRSSMARSSCKDGHLTTLDLGPVIERHNKISREMLERAGARNT